MSDVSGWIEIPGDRVARLKRELLELNIAEVQHLINHLQKERDDVLVAVSFTHSFFTMDIPHFKEFKSWLQSEGVLDMNEVIAESIKSIQYASAEDDTLQHVEDQEAVIVHSVTGAD